MLFVLKFHTTGKHNNIWLFGMQIFNEFNARKPDEKNIFKGITKNRLFMGIVAITIVLQVRLVDLFCCLLGHIGVALSYNFIAVCQIIIIEFLGKFMTTVRLNWKHWIISIVIGFIRLFEHPI